MSNFQESDPFVRHLLSEHHRLHEMLQQARQVIAGAKEASEILPTLQEVREELRRHFIQEEQGGCLEEAASHCPALTPDVQRLEDEHPRLLADLDRLVAQVEDAEPGIQDRLALQNRFMDLCRELHAHEAAENRLLARGFGTNVNGDEIGSSTDALRRFHAPVN